MDVHYNVYTKSTPYPIPKLGYIEFVTSQELLTGYLFSYFIY